MKLIVIGLDGASFPLIMKFCNEGLLPNISKIIEMGKCAPLNSTIPPHTAPGWVSSLTGVLPGEHGIYQFWDTQSPNYVGKFMGSNNVAYPYIWDILNEAGYSTGLINIPMSHPPKKVNGYIITWPLSNTLRYCYPNNLIKEIANNEGHYVSDLLTMFNGDEKYIYDAIKITKRRLKTLLYLIKNKSTDFVMSVFTEIDRVSHFYWHYMNDDSVNNKMKNAIKDIYIETDKILGELLKQIDKNTSILVYSDHGFEKGIMDFYVQTFLIKNKLMYLKKAPKNYCIKGNWFELENNDEIYIVDWDKTIAFMAAPGSYGININLKNRQKLGIVSNQEYDNVCQRIINTLKHVKNPITNNYLFKSVCKREEVYNGKSLASAPDIILTPENYGIMVSHKLTKDSVFNMSPEQKGMHSTEGIILFYGDKPLDVPNNIEEVAQFILKFFNINIPLYMNNNSYNIDKSDHMKKNTILSNQKTSYSVSEEESIKKRLETLGYY